MSRKCIVLAVSASAIVSLAALWVYRRQQRRHCPSNKKHNTTIANDKLEQQFQQAAKASRDLQNLQNGDKLLLYGLYKQATVGDCNEQEEPSRFDVVQHAKYEARLKFQGMPCDDAMNMYIQIVREFSTCTEMEYETQELDMFNAMGAKPSTLANEYEQEDSTTTIPLLKAARDGNVHALKEALQQMNGKTSTIVSTADESGQTALHFAADRGNCQVVELLLDAGANPNATDLEGIGVLQAAVIAGHNDVASILLKFGANPHQADMDGDTPYSCAQDDGSEEMKLLFDGVKEDTTAETEYWG